MKKKQKSLMSEVADAVTGAFGKEAIVNFKKSNANIEWLSTGISSVDEALGGGFPRGRIIEVYGPNASGKTTLALRAIAALQMNEDRKSVV